MSSSRWDPWGDIVSLREAMNSLLEESFVRPRPTLPDERSAALPVDVREFADRFEVIASVPGVSPDDVEITILGDTLRIRGEIMPDPLPESETDEDSRWLIRERRVGAFERGFSLPVSIKADQAGADFRDGVLTISLPKADNIKPHSIPVRAVATGDER